MWAKVAEEMDIPWRAVEAMHWQLGRDDIAQRAGVVPFTLETGPHTLPLPSRLIYMRSNPNMPTPGPAPQAPSQPPRYGGANLPSVADIMDVLYDTHEGQHLFP